MGTVPAAARELSGALAEEQRDMAVISPLVNALPQWANVPPGEDVRQSCFLSLEGAICALFLAF